MKPFTLEWWLEQMTAAIELKCDSDGLPGKEPSKLDKFDLEAIRYYKLEGWIARRILRKYGERPE